MDSSKYKNLSDKELKDQGNKQFAARNFDGAIDSYTLAIIKNSNVPHYYTNRALCYLNQKRWPQAVQDARQALEKDPNLVKGHFYLGKKPYYHTYALNLWRINSFRIHSNLHI